MALIMICDICKAEIPRPQPPKRLDEPEYFVTRRVPGRTDHSGFTFTDERPLDLCENCYKKLVDILEVPESTWRAE